MWTRYKSIIPYTLFSELLLWAVSELYTKLKAQRSWVTWSYLTGIRSVSGFLRVMRRAVAQQHSALLSVPASVAMMLLLITAAWAPGPAELCSEDRW